MNFLKTHESEQSKAFTKCQNFLDELHANQLNTVSSSDSTLRVKLRPEEMCYLLARLVERWTFYQTYLCRAPRCQALLARQPLQRSPHSHHLQKCDHVYSRNTT